ncbi:hypothetical protein Q9L58_006080 [Maublancomyces gigas]|uniref:Uncharacterized protein n=1 Tax=Discina gigas TaxID=1032678 RepID=A0ABR3GGR7_9PEZI
MEHFISPLITVPNEVLYMIAKCLEKGDVLSLLQTNSTFHLPLRSLLISEHKNDVLLYAAWSNNLDLLKLALCAGADVSCRKSSIYDCLRLNNTALDRAACGGYTAIITELLRYNPPLEERNRHMNPPLHSAVENGHQAAVDLLLAAGCDPTARGHERRTIFKTAVISGLESTATKFIDQIAEDSIITIFSMKRLGIARLIKPIAPYIGYAAAAGVEFVKLCLADGARVNDLDTSTNGSALAVAAETGNIEVVQFLLDQGANPNAGPNWRRPIIIAARCGHIDVVRCLLEHGVDLTSLNTGNTNVLLVACASSPAQIVAMLLDAGQKLKIDGDGRDKRKPAPLHVAAENGNFSVITLLLERGAKVNAIRGPKQETALHRAARLGKSGAVEALLEGGADPSIRCNGFTALMLASNPFPSKVRTMAALVKGGADINELRTRSRELVSRILLGDEEQ